tara:strand:+ start:1765 stop:1881 length:117 start_codon:yes stop_codon:yes gene_type:complete
MTRQYNTETERDIHRIAVTLEKILKILKEGQPKGVKSK